MMIWKVPSHKKAGSRLDILFFSIIQTSELGVTEHIEGDPCKFALWAGRTPSSDNKTVLKVGLCSLLISKALQSRSADPGSVSVQGER